MTKRDYVLLAAALNNAKPGGNQSYAAPPSREAYTAWLASCCAVSDALVQDNSRFDSDRFLTACGVSE